MNFLVIEKNLHSIQSWIEDMEERLERVDADMTQLQSLELKFENDVNNLSGDLQKVMDVNKPIIIDDVREITMIVRKIVHDLIGPL